MTRAASRSVDVALGVECAWPLVRAEEVAAARQMRIRARRARRWQRLAVAVFASVVVVSMLGVIVGTTELSTALPAAVPLHTE